MGAIERIALPAFCGVARSQFPFQTTPHNLCVIKNKSQVFHRNSSSVGKCACSEFTCPSSTLEKVPFCWIGFCARDDFKHSEAKWRQLPWSLSETLLTTCRLTLQCTKLERSPRALGERSFAKLQSLQTGHWLASHVIILKAQRSCFQNATGILFSLSVLAKCIGSTCISGNILD